mgnify:CR=1 FL=1
MSDYMKIFNKITGVLLALSIGSLCQSCMDDTPPLNNPDPFQDEKETRIMPASPSTTDQVNVITYDCKYYALASVTEKGKDITIKRRFNGQLKWPCILVYDTIPLGKLKQGNYSVILLTIDTNPMTSDSIFSKETLELIVKK